MEAERLKMDITKVQKERDHLKLKVSELKITIKGKNKIIDENQEKVDQEQKTLKVLSGIIVL